MEIISTVLMMWSAMYGVISFILFMTVASWVLYVKANQPGWTIFIPIYNLYVLHKIAGKPGWWLIFWFVPFPLVSLIIAVIIFLPIAENFGKGVGYGLGLIFLSPIFLPMLAFGDAEYEG